MMTQITIQFLIVLLIMASLLSSLVTMYLPKIKRWFNKKIKVVIVWKNETLEEKITQIIEKKKIIEDIVREEVKNQLLEILNEDKKGNNK